MRALRYEVRCSSGIHPTILPPPSGARPRAEPKATEAPRSKRTTMRASPAPPSSDGAPISDDEATAPTLPAPAAVLVEGSVEDDRSTIVPPPLSVDRQKSLFLEALAILDEAHR